MHALIWRNFYLLPWNFLLQPIASNEIELTVLEIPSVVRVDRPFSVNSVSFNSTLCVIIVYPLLYTIHSCVAKNSNFILKSFKLIVSISDFPSSTVSGLANLCWFEYVNLETEPVSVSCSYTWSFQTTWIGSRAPLKFGCQKVIPVRRKLLWLMGSR